MQLPCILSERALESEKLRLAVGLNTLPDTILHGTDLNGGQKMHKEGALHLQNIIMLEIPLSSYFSLYMPLATIHTILDFP